MRKVTLRNHLNESMRERDTVKTGTIRLLLSAIQYDEMKKEKAGYEATDEEIMNVIRHEVKKRNEAIVLYKQGKREDLVKKESEELAILETYLPKQMSEDEVRTIVLETIKQVVATSPSDMGKVMGAVMPKVKGKVDGGVVSSLVREALS
ncbi:GatB/YqeY domain-containing protein [Candidatus Roizmanbacteria bacterium]|nr:GatB/YqeY domain-containing protein [Candidatus Roizmanbacteria bacterium]